LPCKYVEGSDCYAQTRAQDADPVLNGWQLGVRRLSEEDWTSKGWSEYVSASWQDLREPFLSGSWQKADKEDVKPKPKPKPEKKRRRRREVKNLPRPARRLQQGVVSGKRKASKEKAVFRPTWLYSFRNKKPEKHMEKRVEGKVQQDRSGQKARRLAEISSDTMEALPNPYGYNLAYTQVVPMSMTIEAVQMKITEWQTESHSLMTDNTLIFGVETLIQNPETSILTHVTVNFMFSRGGQVFSQVKLWSLPLAANGGANATFAVYFMMLSAAGVMLIVQARASIKNGYAGAWFSSLATLLQMWLVVCGMAVCIMFLVCQTEIGRYVELKSTYGDNRPGVDQLSLEAYDITNFRKLHSVVQPASNMDCDLLTLIVLYNVCMMFQFLIASKGHPRLALLVKTLELSFQDILHLFVVFIFIFAAYVIAGHIMLGAKIYDYSTIMGSVGRAIQQIMHSETNWEVITSEDYWTAALWIWTMLAVVGFVVINVVLAVVFDAYVLIARYITDEDNLSSALAGR